MSPQQSTAPRARQEHAHCAAAACSAGVEIFGNGGKAGVVASFSFLWNQATQWVDGTSDQTTNTGTMLVSVDPSSGVCHELAGHMMRNTQKGVSTLGVVVKGYVGFADTTTACVK